MDGSLTPHPAAIAAAHDSHRGSANAQDAFVTGQGAPWHVVGAPHSATVEPLSTAWVDWWVSSSGGAAQAIHEVVARRGAVRATPMVMPLTPVDPR